MPERPVHRRSRLVSAKPGPSYQRLAKHFRDSSNLGLTAMWGTQLDLQLSVANLES
jgi:hypothetical protein